LRGSRVYKATHDVIYNLFEWKVSFATREDFIKSRASGDYFWGVVVVVHGQTIWTRNWLQSKGYSKGKGYELKLTERV